MKRCTRCIFPETVPNITFNNEGVCNFCLQYERPKPLGEEELKKIISDAKAKNNLYDCIVPLSGGRDSTFILYLAKAKYGLKVLAINYDNEFRVAQALRNMNKACEILNVDFISVRSKRNIAHKIVKQNILAAPAFGEFGLCAACGYGYRSVVYKAAEEHKVPLILWGASKNESTLHMQKIAFSGLRKSKYRKLLKPNFYFSEFFSLLQRLEFHVSGNNPLSRSKPVLKDKNIKEIYLFDYLPWDRNKIKETITKELDWNKSEHDVSTWRIDCMFHTLVNFCFFKLLGCSKDCFGYCNMINSSQMNRDEALRQEEKMAANLYEGLRELLEDKIGLSREIATKIISFDREKVSF